MAKSDGRGAPGGTGMLLLALLERRDMYGYEMVEALRAQSKEIEAQGWVTSSDGTVNGRTRRTYSITREGREALAGQRAEWSAYADAVRGVLEGGDCCGA